MTRLPFLAFLAIGPAAAIALMAAQNPAALARTSPGLWEITGMPGVKAPARQCVGDIAVLARFEHRGRNCTQKVITDGPSSTVIEYSCGSGGFGRSDMRVLTPRSLRIDTQGISDQLPFHYVLQARRVGECPDRTTASRH